MNERDWYQRGSLSPYYQAKMGEVRGRMNGQSVQPPEQANVPQPGMPPQGMPPQGVPQGMPQGMMPPSQDMQTAQNVQQTQAANRQAFPQNREDIPVNQPANPHQAFIQQAMSQGFPPDMVMQFLRGKIGGQ